MASSLYDDVLNRVGRSVVSGEFPAGTKLVLSDLEERYRVSRTVARDVVKVIESLGLATSRRRAGIEIQPQEKWRVLDPTVIGWRMAVDQLGQLASLTELREAVEPRAARLAALEADDHEIERLAATSAVMDSLGARGQGLSRGYLDADMEFHTTLLQASHNEMFCAMMPMVRAVLRGRHDYQLTPAWPDLDAMTQHVRIAEAIAAHDPDAAEHASRHQLDIVRAELRAPVKRS